jgi:hypothetical protein
VLTREAKIVRASAFEDFLAIKDLGDQINSMMLQRI